MIISADRVAARFRVLDPGWVEIRDDAIVAVGGGMPDAPADVALGPRWLVPGFVDIHVHGGAGAEFQHAEAAEVRRILDFHRSHGTTTALASLVTGPLEELTRAVAGLSELVADGLLAGVHLEGPFLSDAHRGAHPPGLLRPPTPEALSRLLGAGHGTIRMVTLAPELPGGMRAIRQVIEAGAVAAVGHTAAGYDQTRAAVEAGAGVATHLYNGMPEPLHRAPGPAMALLEADRVTVELIMDGVHVHPAMARAAARLAGPGRLALVTDAMAAAGMDDGQYRLGSLEVTVRGGEARLGEGGSLAGSTLTLDVALRNAVVAGIPFADALAAVTATPARVIGMAGEAGTIAAGRRADLVVLNNNLTVESVMAGGVWEPAHIQRDQTR
jgi:N-acetylglucosamine-6-phosphate deacetylase